MPASKGRKKKAPSQTNNQGRMAGNVEISQSQREKKNLGPTTIQHSRSFYQGIVPSPEMMEQYKAVDESLPILLVNLTRDEAEHRRKIESKITSHAFTSLLFGQILAFLSVIAICFLSYLFMIHNNSEDGRNIAISIILSLAALFLGKRIFSPKDSEKTKS